MRNLVTPWRPCVVPRPSDISLSLLPSLHHLNARQTHSFPSSSTNISTFTTQVYTHYLSNIIPWLKYTSFSVPFAESYASSSVLFFTDLKFVITMLLPWEVCCVSQKVSVLQYICTYCGIPRLIQSHPRTYHMLNISSTHSISEVENLASLQLLKFLIYSLANYHSHLFIFIPFRLGLCCLENLINDHIWLNIGLVKNVFNVPGGLVHFHWDLEDYRSDRDTNS